MDRPVELENPAIFVHSDDRSRLAPSGSSARVGHQTIPQPAAGLERAFIMIPRSRFAIRIRRLVQISIVLAVATVSHAQESWDAVYLGGSKIGFVHTTLEQLKEKGKDFIRVRIDMELSLKRGNDISLAKLSYGTIETPAGQVLKLDTLTMTGDGGSELRGHGNVIRGKMNFVLEGAGQQQQLQIPWSPEVRGPYAAEQSMARQPLKENEQRSLKMFMPELNKICDIKLQSKGIESVILGDNAQRPLLRVEQTTQVDGKPRPEFDATMWVDTQGQIMKSHQDLLDGYVMFRTTEAGARAPTGPIKFDLIKSTVIKVAPKIPTPERTRSVKYRLTLKDGELGPVIPTDPRQNLQPIPGQQNSGVLEVKSVGVLDGAPGPVEIDPQYLNPNALVTSQDGRVRSLALRATRGVVDPWQKVERINRFVYESIKDKNFGIAFAAASEVARNLSGDCTEHSVLAAAMYRAVGIPSRVVIGLVYVERLDGFGYHMWNEVYVNQRWIALDPTWDQSTVDAVHIKLSDSSLEGVSPIESFLPIVRVMGRLEIEPIEIR
jgi:transglutaminase-like putative cysteine protease